MRLFALTGSLVGFGTTTAIALLVDRKRARVEPARLDIGVFENILVVIPAFATWSLCLFWVLVAPAFPFSDTWAPPSGGTFLRAVGGFVGMVALWVSGSPRYVAKLPHGSLFCAIGLIAGVVASLGVVWARHAGTLDVDIPMWLAYLVLIPVAVAIRRVVQFL
jgi:hypothetical protein